MKLCIGLLLFLSLVGLLSLSQPAAALSATPQPFSTTAASPSTSPAPTVTSEPTSSPQPFSSTTAPSPLSEIPPDPTPELPYCEGHGPPKPGPTPPLPPTSPPPAPTPEPTSPPPPPSESPPPPPPAPVDPCKCLYQSPNGWIPCPVVGSECKPPTPAKTRKECRSTAYPVVTVKECFSLTGCTPTDFEGSFLNNYLCPIDPNNCPASIQREIIVKNAVKCTKCKYYSEPMWRTFCERSYEEKKITVTVNCAVKEFIEEEGFPGQDGVVPADARSCFLRNDEGLPPNTCSPGTCNWVRKSADSGCTAVTTIEGFCKATNNGGNAPPPVPNNATATRRNVVSPPSGSVQVTRESLFVGESVDVSVSGIFMNGLSCFFSRRTEDTTTGVVKDTRLFASDPQQVNFSSTMTDTPTVAGWNYYTLTCANVLFGWKAVWVEVPSFWSSLEASSSSVSVGTPVTLSVSTFAPPGPCSLTVVYPVQGGGLHLSTVSSWTGAVSGMQTQFTPLGASGDYWFSVQCGDTFGHGRLVTVL